MLETSVPPGSQCHQARVKSPTEPFSRWLPPLLITFGLLIFSSRAPAGEPQQYASATTLKKLSMEELMNIEVTSVARQPEPYGQAPAAIQVITSEDIRRSGASSLPEALRLADNLAVARKNSHDWAISTRGFNTELANKLLVMMDGRTVYTPLFSGVFWNVQDYLLADLDRIEVVSGPGGTLWGANAVNGVINILSKSAKDTQGFYTEVGGGNVLRDFVGVRYGGTLASNVFFRVYGKYFDRDNEVVADGSDEDDAWWRGQGGFRLDAELSPQNNLTLQGDLYGSNQQQPTGRTAVNTGGNILGRWTHTFSEDADVSLQLYYDRTHFTDPLPAFAIGSLVLSTDGTLKDDLDTYDLDFQNRFRLAEHHQVIWGLGYRFTHDVVQNAPPLGFSPEVLDHHLFSGFLQDEVELFDNLFFTLGTKVEHNGYTGVEVEPSARLQWNVTAKHMLWAAVSRAVRTPSRVDRDLTQPAPPNFLILRGDSDFDSETVIAYELGYRGQLGPKVSASVSAFYNDYDDLRSAGITTGTVLPFYFQNALEGETYGGELSVTFQASDWWRLRVGYNLIEEDIRVQPSQSDLNNALNETGDPEHQVALHSFMNLGRYLEFDAGLRWVDTLELNNSGTVATVPDYFELDVRLGWHITKSLELSIVGQNLLHDHHPEYGLPGAGRGEIRRSVYGKLTWQF